LLSNAKILTTTSSKQILGEERDPFRLRDRNNRPVLCFRCGGSAVRSAISGDPAMASLDTSSRPPSPTPTSPLPPPDALSLTSSPIDVVMDDQAFAAAPPEAQALLALSNSIADNASVRAGTKRKREPSPIPSSGANNTESGPRTRRRTEHGPKPSIGDSSVDFGRPILSCDYCSLHWHMDCLDPPMTGIPAKEKKWMCPNHIEHMFVSQILILPSSAPYRSQTGYQTSDTKGHQHPHGNH
jgi:PHD-finger